MARRRGLVLRRGRGGRVLAAGKGPGAVGPAGYDRLFHGAHRTARGQRQAGAARHEDLGGGDQQEGRVARASGQTGLLRRPVEPLDSAGHLHQAHRRRQGRPRARALRHRPGRPGHAGHHAEGQGLHHPVRARCEPRVQLPEILRDDPDRAGYQAVLHRRLLRGRRGAESETATVALVAADQEFSRNACDGARDNAKKANLKIVYDKTYPPSTTDFTPIVRAIQAANPDVVTICSYPLDSVGMVKAVNELNYKPKMIGGAMVGLQATVFKRQLGPLLNGWVNYETWVPAKALTFDGTEAFLKQYQARAGAEGVDPLGYYLGTWGYAYIQILGEAVQATKSLDDNKLADYIGKTTFKTIMGDVKFGKG